MNCYVMRNRPMYINTYKSLPRKCRGVMEPMSRMTMDFQGRLMDSQGRKIDPRHYEQYTRYNENYRYYPRSMFNYQPFIDGQKYGGWMDFPERYKDLTGYEMDMEGRWIDNYGRYRDTVWTDMCDTSKYF